MSKLFNKAKVRLESAKSEWDKRNMDDAYIDAACFDLQQSMEFMLKALVELNGGVYVQNHDLRAQLNKLNHMGVSYDFFEEIRRNAYIYNSWETESRYKDNFVALSQDVETAFTLCNKMVQKIETIVTIETEPGDKMNIFDK